MSRMRARESMFDIMSLGRECRSMVPAWEMKLLSICE